MTPTAMWGIGIAVALKLAAAGYVAHVAMDPTADRTRANLLGHTKAVIAKLQEIGHAPEETYLRSLTEDIQVLKRGASMGWTAKYEIGAAARVSYFVLKTHVEGTGRGVVEVLDNMAAAAFDSLFKLFDTPQGNPDGNVRFA